MGLEVHVCLHSPQMPAIVGQGFRAKNEEFLYAIGWHVERHLLRFKGTSS